VSEGANGQGEGKAFKEENREKKIDEAPAEGTPLA